MSGICKWRSMVFNLLLFSCLCTGSPRCTYIFGVCAFFYKPFYHFVIFAPICFCVECNQQASQQHNCSGPIITLTIAHPSALFSSCVWYIFCVCVWTVEVGAPTHSSWQDRVENGCRPASHLVRNVSAGQVSKIERLSVALMRIHTHHALWPVPQKTTHIIESFPSIPSL